MKAADLWLIIILLVWIPFSFILPALLEAVEDKWRAYKGLPPFPRAK